MSTAVKRCERCGIVLDSYNGWRDEGRFCTSCGIYVYDQQHGYGLTRMED